MSKIYKVIHKKWIKILFFIIMGIIVVLISMRQFINTIIMPNIEEIVYTYIDEKIKSDFNITEEELLKVKIEINEQDNKEINSILENYKDSPLIILKINNNDDGKINEQSTILDILDPIIDKGDYNRIKNIYNKYINN